MKIFLKITFFALTILSLSCDRRTEIGSKITPQYESLVSVKEDSLSIVFHLDSVSQFHSPCIQYFTDPSGKSYFTRLNLFNNSIYFYSMPSTQFLFRTSFATEGPNSIGEVITGYKIVSLDSIIIIGRYNLSLSDTSGIPYYKFSFLNKKIGDFTALPEATTPQSIEKEGKFIYLSAAVDKTPFDINSFKDEQCKIIFNIEKRTFEFKMRYPELYRKNTYSYNHMVFYHAYNPNSRKFVYSFTVDPQVYETDSKHQNILEHWAGSDYLGAVQPIPPDQRGFEQYTRHYLVNPLYSYIYYDEYRNIYYRVAEQPISEDDYENRKWWKKKSVIVLDSAFNKIGESFVDDYLSMNMGFVTSEGFYIAKAPKPGKTYNENKLNFIKLNISKHEN